MKKNYKKTILGIVAALSTTAVVIPLVTASCGKKTNNVQITIDANGVRNLATTSQVETKASVPFLVTFSENNSSNAVNWIIQDINGNNAPIWLYVDSNNYLSISDRTPLSTIPTTYVIKAQNANNTSIYSNEIFVDITIYSSSYEMLTFALKNPGLPNQYYEVIECDPNYNGSILIPDTMDEGIPVKSIGEAAFSSCLITAINMGNNVEIIKDAAFANCLELLSVQLGNTKIIGDYAFTNCMKITSIDVSNVQLVGQESFSYCFNLTNVDLGNINLIGIDAFGFCPISNITINPSNQFYCFANNVGNAQVIVDVEGATPRQLNNDCSNVIGCLAIGNLTIPAEVSTINNFAFAACSGITSVDLSNTTIISQSAFLGCVKITSINLSNIVMIKDYAFAGCRGLTSIDFSNVAYLGDGAFRECENLTAVNLANLQHIGAYSFQECPLVNISIDSNNTYYVLADNLDNGQIIVPFVDGGVKTNCSNIVGSLVAGDVLLPDTVNYIAAFAFEGCFGLTSIQSNNTIISIHESAFANCEQLSSLNFARVLDTGDFVFSNCIGLVNVDLSTTDVIGEYAFTGCVNLQTIDLTNAQAINEGAFWGCEKLSSVILDEILIIDKNAFFDCLSLAAINLCLIQMIGDSAFAGCLLSSITIDPINTHYVLANNVGSGQIIVPFADGGINSNCSNIIGSLVVGDVELDSSVTTIRSSAFERCLGLTSIEWSTVSFIDNYAFIDCRNLVSVTSDRMIPPSLGNNMVFLRIDSNATLYVPDVNAYASWSPYFGGGIIEI